MKISDDLSRRVPDDEVLFVTLLLMFGEPPIPAGRYDQLSNQLMYVHNNRRYSGEIKDMMAELGHNPSLGLFTEYMHWCKEQWNGKANKKI